MTQTIYYRSADLSRAEIDEQNRTIVVAFSSEQSVQRSFGLEVLSHNPIDVDLSFLASGRAPLLLEHEREDQIGVVESATIDQDKVGRAVIRFSKGKEGDEVFQDVLDGIRSNISVGYKITGQRIEQDDMGNNIVYCQWTPVEISVVSIPADQTVGIGRSDDTIESQSINNNEPGSHSSDEARDSQVAQKTSDSQVAQTTSDSQIANEVTTEAEIADLTNTAQRSEQSIKGKNTMTIETQFDADSIRSAERARVSEITSIASVLTLKMSQLSSLLMDVLLTNSVLLS